MSAPLVAATDTPRSLQRFSVAELVLLTGILGSQGLGLRLGDKSVEVGERTAAGIDQIAQDIGELTKRLDDHDTSIRRQDMALQTLALQLGELERRIAAVDKKGRSTR